MCAVIGIFAIGNTISIISRRSNSRRMGNRHCKRDWRLVASSLTDPSICMASSGSHLRLAWCYWYLWCNILLWWASRNNFTVLHALIRPALTLGPKPYYWPNTKKLSYGGSPPLATKSEWMAVALLPFVMWESLPINFSTLDEIWFFFTGSCPQNSVVSRFWLEFLWKTYGFPPLDELGDVCAGSSPHLPFHRNSYPKRRHDAAMEDKRGLLDRCCCAHPPSIFEYHVHWRYSVGHTISQSLPSRTEAYKWFGNRFYEFFKATHFLAVGFFIVFFFIHCDFRLTSW